MGPGFYPSGCKSGRRIGNDRWRFNPPPLLPGGKNGLAPGGGVFKFDERILAAANTSRRGRRKPGNRWRKRCTRSEVSGGTPKIPRGRKIFLPRDCFRSRQISVHPEYGGFRFRPRPQRFYNRRRSPSTPRIAKSENAGMGRKMPFMDGHNLEIRELLVVIQRDHRLR
jgi:hypothetical protein